MFQQPRGKKRAREDTMVETRLVSVDTNDQQLNREDSEEAAANRESRYKDKLCEFCSTSYNQIYHHHFSSARQRSFHIIWSKGDFMCPVCHILEPPLRCDTPDHRVILSDSTLYGVWDNKELPNVAQHFDIECIVGGRIRDLTHALKKNLLRNSYRFEIILIAGINNIAEGQDATEVVIELNTIKKVVADHSIKNKHEKPSYVSICTLALPPKYCSLRLPDNVDQDMAEWIPAPSFKNKYPIFKQVNEKIKQINIESGLSFLNLHLQGIKMLKSGPQHKFDTRPGATRIWRETEVSKKLHFTADNKLKIIQYLQNTFKRNA